MAEKKWVIGVITNPLMGLIYNSIYNQYEPTLPIEDGCEFETISPEKKKAFYGGSKQRSSPGISWIWDV